MANVGLGVFEPWTASGGDDVVGSASFSAWTATGQSTPGAVPSFEAWTSAGESSAGARAAVTLLEWTATGTSHSTPVFGGSPSFEAWTATGSDRWQGVATFEEFTSTSFSRGNINAAASFEAWFVSQNYGFPRFERLNCEARS